MSQNSNLANAKRRKNDEFFTERHDVEAELNHYKNCFRNKIVYCNCDDPTTSAFWRYFYRSFDYLGLKMLISTHYRADGLPSYALLFSGGKDENGQLFSNGHRFDGGTEWRVLKGNGDFRSKECIELLKMSDVVVTNPPFSLAREYVKQLMDYHKKFLIIGNLNWVTYKQIFPLLMSNQIWIGANSVKEFKQPDGSTKKFGNVGWFTNLPLVKSTDVIRLVDHFDQSTYPAYDNYAAFNVDRVANIPVDRQITAFVDRDNLPGWQKTYGDDLKVLDSDGKDNGDSVKVAITRPIWGVPITFLDRYNPSSDKKDSFAKMFEIKGITDRQATSGLRIKKYTKKDTPRFNDLNARSVIKFGNDYKAKYARILIRKK